MLNFFNILNFITFYFFVVFKLTTVKYCSYTFKKYITHKVTLSASRYRKFNQRDRGISNQLITKEEVFDRDKLENKQWETTRGVLVAVISIFAWYIWDSGGGKGLTRRIETVVRL